MCSVWQSDLTDRLAPAHIAKLPCSLRTVNLTGGEPFLHPQLPDFVSAVRSHLPKAVTTISTNGLLSDRIIQMTPDLLDRDKHLRIAVSIDGLADTHDRIRGLPGAFDRAIQTVEHLKSINFLGLRLAMTLAQANSDKLLAVADLAQEFNLELSLVPAHASEVHFLTSDTSTPEMNALLPQLEVLVSRLLRSASPRQWLRAHFADRVKKYLTGSLPKFSCRAGRDFFFLQSDGTLYPCNVCSPALGNIVETDFHRIWSSSPADSPRCSLAKCPRQCWMVCTARSYYRAHPLDVLFWIVAHKTRAHWRALFNRQS
jgi:radical SAM protein with 4Fe4S-binding SPASM domain